MSGRLIGAVGKKYSSTWKLTWKLKPLVSHRSQQQRHILTTATTMSLRGKSNQSELRSYSAPSWVQGKLNPVPKYTIRLAQLPTPIHKWTLPGLPEAFSLSIKRDDLTGSTLSGNKVRKLEFLLADAISKGCSHVVTCGGIQSNHCRATAVAAAQVGLQPHLFLREDIKAPEEVGCQGNLLLNRLSGARMYFIPRKSAFLTDIKPRMEQLADKIKRECGGDLMYQIPVGGSNHVGVFGYIQAFEEMIQQGVLDNYDDIVFACGSGGTGSGLAIGNYLTGSRVKVHAIIVSDSSAYFEGHVNGTLHDLRVHGLEATDILDIIDGYKGLGYGISTQNELEFIGQVSSHTGVMLDPVYGGKAAYGLQQELTKSPERFQGNRILFIHTGGIFGLLDGRMDVSLKMEDSVTNQIFMWRNMKDVPKSLL